MFVFLNSKLHQLQKISLSNNTLNNKNISLDAISIRSLFLLGSIWFTITASTYSFICVKFFTLQNKICTYRKLKKSNFCTYVLHKRHEQFFGDHLRIVILNSVGDTVFFHSVGKISHIFGPKLDIVSESNMSFNISTLQRCALSKTIIAFLLGNYFCQYFRRYVIFYFKHFIC